MLTLCERCVRGTKRRNETALVKEIDNSDETRCCDWCDRLDSVLYGVYFSEHSFDIDYEGDCP